MNQLNRFNRVRYTIYGNTFGSQIIEEPKGWDQDNLELMRSTKFEGIMTVLNSSLEFYGLGFQLLKGEKEVNGIKANVRLEREERNENTDEWELNYSANFDFSTYKQKKNYISIKMKESEFFSNIESRFKDNYELERLKDLKNGVLEPLVYKKLLFQGTDIFRETFYNNEDNIVKAIYKGSSSFDALVDFAIPLFLKYKSDENFVETLAPVDSANFLDVPTAKIIRIFDGHVVYNAGTVFFLVSDKQKTININIKIKVKAKFNTPNNPLARFRIFLDKIHEDGGNELESFEETVLLDVSNDTGGEFGIVENELKEFTIDYTTDIDLAVGDSLGLRMNPFFGSPYLQNNQWYFEFKEVEILAQEIDIAETTDCNALTYYQVFERLFKIVTGKNSFQSTLLSTTWKDLLFTNGFKIRQVPDKNITTSLEEVYNSLSAIDDICLIIQNNTVRVEKKGDVYQNIVGIDLGNVLNIEREIEASLHYSNVEIGCDFNGLYEEVNGLDEFNIRTSYSTCLTALDNKFSAISKVRFDGYGATLAQIEQYINNPKKDTKYDKFNFAFDCYLVSTGIYRVRHWEMDFDVIPTGIFSPNTAINLRLSPFNSVLRKSKTISTGLQLYPTELFEYASTEGNSQLVTDYPERVSIQNDVLSVPYFLPETISFEKKISMAQFQYIVNNPYKLIKFVNEFNKIEYGFIRPSVKPSKEGKFVLIKANI